jgi:TolB-like protein/Tfp pilus assembly protein PilF/DNA-binding winged helix-turn-helix (wHTH) protein
MAHAAISAPVFQFGVFTADVAAGELRKHGLRIKLQDRPFRLLIMLLERQGELVTREEIRASLWPDGTFVDFDHGINSAVNKLRTTLNDSALHPRYVETVGRRGYRFIYPTTAAPPLRSEAASPPLVATVPSRASRWRVPLLLMVTAVPLVLAGFVFWKLTRPSAAPAKIRSIAVLPLKNLSSDPEQEYFSEGLTDELITRLASLEGLKVISRTSSLQYKDSNKPLPQIAKELKVDAVVEGSVLRSGDRVRITAQLIESSSDRHLWAQSYERPQRDIFALQNEVTRDIANNILITLEPADRARLAKSRTLDPVAHETYLRGRHAWSKRRVEEMKAAAAYFEQAIARDPEYALAYAGLADCYALLGGYSSSPQEEFMPKARAAATKAVQLDPSLSEAHQSLALIAQNYDIDWTTAEKEYRRAIELDPNNATAHHWYGEFLSFEGRFPEALEQIERARELDPFSLIVLTDRAVILYYARRYDESIRQFQEVLARDPKFPRASMIVLPYAQLGRYQDAFAYLDRPTKMLQSFDLAFRAYLYGRAGDIPASKRFTRRLESSVDIHQRDVGPLLFAYLGVGDNDKAFMQLERGLTQHSTVLTSLKVNPIYDPLRNDPRFKELLQRVRLDP